MHARLQGLAAAGWHQGPAQVRGLRQCRLPLLLKQPGHHTAPELQCWWHLVLQVLQHHPQPQQQGQQRAALLVLLLLLSVKLPHLGQLMLLLLLGMQQQAPLLLLLGVLLL